MYGKNQGRASSVFYAYVIFDSPKGVEVALKTKVIGLYNTQFVM